MGDCEAEQLEDCGDCGQRSCDSTTLTWSECVGDGTQQNCWESEEGDPPPGTLPEEPEGKCTVGVQTCQADGNWSACTGAVASKPSDDCDVAGDDSDCNGSPNDGCNCSPGTTRDCGKDDGNCQQGEQTCTANIWGTCEGEITPEAADSRLVTGDDADCDGMENENCACVADNANACNDSVACTDNVCTNGVCTNPASAGFCRIGGSCYAHNAQEPGNPCHFCDANANRTGWSNSASSVSCDDGSWCNGTDTCSAGTCAHEFTSNRCTASGPCALSVCDETRDSCFRPNTFVCSSAPETRCSSTSACGGDIQTRTVEKRCTGSSATCDGSPSNPSWTTATDCTTSQICSQSGSNFTCNDKLGCGSTWCPSPDRRPVLDHDRRAQRKKLERCDQLLRHAERRWEQQLAAADRLGVSRYRQGCNGAMVRTDNYGTPTTGASTCAYNETGGAFDCAPCKNSESPFTPKCYWAAGLGQCQVQVGSGGGYWTSTHGSINQMGFDPSENDLYITTSDNSNEQVRCVTTNTN